jgi:hypothetical protein
MIMVYIHVSDLTSPYNIDHTRLVEELARVKAEAEKPEPVGGELRLEVPSVLETCFPQKRLQPPRGGYNLCV